jgi:hypothetical protein
MEVIDNILSGDWKSKFVKILNRGERDCFLLNFIKKIRETQKRGPNLKAIIAAQMCRISGLLRTETEKCFAAYGLCPILPYPKNV